MKYIFILYDIFYFGDVVTPVIEKKHTSVGPSHTGVLVTECAFFTCAAAASPLQVTCLSTSLDGH